jgi:hypothetical protein
MNMRNIDMVIGIDDDPNIALMRLFNEEKGHEYLLEEGIPEEIISKLQLLGISSIANIMGAIKTARYYEMNENDFIFTVATDSMEMYQSRLRQEREKCGAYSSRQAAVDFKWAIGGLSTDNMLELSYYDRKRMHNLKYFTWIEQQGKTIEELNAQWYDEHYWENQFNKMYEWDEKIKAFNERTGLLKKLLY